MFYYLINNIIKTGYLDYLIYNFDYKLFLYTLKKIFLYNIILCDYNIINIFNLKNFTNNF